MNCTELGIWLLWKLPEEGEKSGLSFWLGHLGGRRCHCWEGDRRRDRHGERCLVPFLTDPSSILCPLTVPFHHACIHPSIMCALWAALNNTSEWRETPTPQLHTSNDPWYLPPAPNTMHTALGPVSIHRQLDSIQPKAWLASEAISFLETDLVGMVALCTYRAASPTISPPTLALHAGGTLRIKLKLQSTDAVSKSVFPKSRAQGLGCRWVIWKMMPGSRNEGMGLRHGMREDLSEGHYQGHAVSNRPTFAGT